MANRMTSRFPAILIGGPPHAGKSVLARSLKETLREARVQCYLLRAAPDGEGDWSHLAALELAQALRRKGRYTPAWVKRMCHDIAYRPLPFLVDVGGRPEPWQESIFDQCTHAILLVKDAETQAFWEDIVSRYNIPIIAILTSVREGEPVIETEQPILRGTISRLDRGERAAGPVFEALLAGVKALFSYEYDELLALHREQAPTDLVVDIPQLYKRLNPTRPGATWQPRDLPAVLAYLPRDTSLALYGIGPAWLYAAVAGYIYPEPFYQFDARRGWVTPVSFIADDIADVPLTITAETTDDYIHLKLDLPEDYIDYRPEIRAPLPVSPGQGVILSGKFPNWLYTGLALFYHHAAWVALYYPHLDRAIVVSTADPGGPYEVGRSLYISHEGQLVTDD